MNWERFQEGAYIRNLRCKYRSSKGKLISKVRSDEHDPESRKTKAYFHWRRAVLARDGFRCAECGSSKPLVAHHIDQWAIDSSQRFMVNNGITLCKSCHAIRHPWLMKKPVIKPFKVVLRKARVNCVPKNLV